MGYVKDFFGNFVLISARLGWFFAQLIKVVIAIFEKDPRPLAQVMFANGGMPSSHASAVMALCTACGISAGLGSAVFAVSFILAAVVMIDASGVRLETGKQAQILNKIAKEIFSGDPELANLGLKELVGHTPFQVLIGAFFGILVAILLSLLML